MKKVIKLFDPDGGLVLFLKGFYLVDVCQNHTVIYNPDDFSSLRFAADVRSLDYCGDNCRVYYNNGVVLFVDYNYLGHGRPTAPRYISCFNKKTVKALNERKK